MNRILGDNQYLGIEEGKDQLEMDDLDPFQLN
jgi:hypothetical protein